MALKSILVEVMLISLVLEILPKVSAAISNSFRLKEAPASDLYNIVHFISPEKACLFGLTEINKGLLCVEDHFGDCRLDSPLIYDSSVVNGAIETRRACVLKALIVYLNQHPENLIREYLDIEDNQETIEQMVLRIFTLSKESAEPTDDLEDVGIIIEGVEVLYDLGNVANALAMLFGLMYSLDLSYQANLKGSAA